MRRWARIGGVAGLVGMAAGCSHHERETEPAAARTPSSGLSQTRTGTIASAAESGRAQARSAAGEGAPPPAFAAREPDGGPSASLEADGGPSASLEADGGPSASLEADGGLSMACGDPGEAWLFVSPARPMRGQRVHAVAITARPVEARLEWKGPGGAVTATAERRGGPPYFWVADVAPSGPGKAHLAFSRDEACGGGSLATKDVTVSAFAQAPVPAPRSWLWITRRMWTPSFENLYAAWIQHLFDAPLDAQPSWTALHDVLRDPARNFLADYLGADEDEQGMVIRPDCADLPYFLRAYFAFKLSLPFGWSHCSRGENGTPPRCTSFATNEDPFPPVDDPPQHVPSWANPDRPHEGPWEDTVKRFGEWIRTVLADAAQSGAGRTPVEDDESDYYSVALSTETLRPGTIYADPYGHVLVLAARIPQAPPGAGVLLAVDGQPDGTVARKRFWRGNFLFAIDPTLGTAGFKRFRPIVRDPATRALRRAKNAELADYSATDQTSAGVDGFYDKVEDVLSPAPLDPTRALLETVDAFEEQVKARVVSVDNGRKFLLRAKGPAAMPDGEKIFETLGDWEDFATPSRDLRLLIAIDLARAIPARVARRIDRFATPLGKNAAEMMAELDARLRQELKTRTITYVRSDGSPWTLSLQDVANRQSALEVAYNPNDCVELRWGAPPGSDEASTCHERAPDFQTEKMATYRAWFHDRTRPPR